MEDPNKTLIAIGVIHNALVMHDIELSEAYAALISCLIASAEDRKKDKDDFIDDVVKCIESNWSK